MQKSYNISHTKPEHAEQLEALQFLVFPNLVDDEILHALQYKKHIEIFPKGQLVALDGDKVVGGSTTMRFHFDLENPKHHTFAETIAGGWLTTHDPNGKWLYGIDVSVHPDYRKMGMAKEFYKIRNQIARELNLKGQLSVGILNGYNKFKNELSIDEYYNKVLIGEIFDPTVSVQQKIGFEIKGLIKNYVHDSTCGNAGVLIILDAKKEI